MSGTQLHHIAALFSTPEQADCAREALVKAGVDPTCVLVLDRAGERATKQARLRLWGALRRRLLPEFDAHHYAEGVARGLPLVIADVTASQHAAAVAALSGCNPVNLEDHAADWRAEGWSGTNDDEQEYIEASDEEREAARSEGITASGIIAGDYGTVGSPIGGSRADTDILHGGRVRSYRLR